jgi:amidohydrolase
MATIREEVEGIFKEVVAWRRDFHMHPELSNNEARTSRKVAELLREFGLEVTENVGGYGVVGLLRGGHGEKTLAIRADMDALPIQEQNDFEYASRVDGVMHACGHDGHTAMLLGTAALLSRMDLKLRGNVKFIFQPAEESAGSSGAARMVEAGVLESPKVDAIVALHLFPFLPLGSVTIGKGPIMAAVDKIIIEVFGRGGHSSQPNNAVDPLLTACKIVSELDSVVTRNTDALDTAVMVICMMQCGSAPNVIADYARMEGSVRSYRSEVQDALKEATERVIEGLCRASGATGKLDYQKLIPSVANDGDLADTVFAACSKGLPQGSVLPAGRPLMGSEDFSFYLRKGVPGVMMMLGGAIAGREPFINHHPRFDWDEAAMKTGMSAFIATAQEYLR